MKQFEFQMINKCSDRLEHARATAATAAIARAQIVLMYGQQFDVMDLHSDVNPPHQVLGEIDCSDFPLADLPWLEREAAAIEGTNHDQRHRPCRFYRPCPGRCFAALAGCPVSPVTRNL